MDMALLDRAPVKGAAYPIPDAALDDRLGWIGTSGSGKTYNAGGGVERLLEAGARVIIVDPLDVWWGLRLTAEGKPSKFTLPIFGGQADR
jgi:DNA helicase HerA-like ATPase